MVRNVEGGAVTIAAPQQISQRTIPTLERQVDDAIAQRAAGVDFLMAATQMIDSAGLNWLLNVQTRLSSASIRMRLTEVSAVVSDIFLATRLDNRLEIVTCDAGVARA